MRGRAALALIAGLSAGAALAEDWPHKPLGFTAIPQAEQPEKPCGWPGHCPRYRPWILWPRAAPVPAVQPLPSLQDARTLVEAGQFRAAQATLADLAERQPQDPAVWALLARAERRLGHPGAAAEGVRRALALDPGHPGALAERGYLALASGQPAQALAALEELTASCGTCAEAIILRSALTGAGYHAGATGPKRIRVAP